MNKLSSLLLPFWGELFIFIKLFGYFPHASWWWLVWFFLTDATIWHYIHESIKKEKPPKKSKPVENVV
jgi:hypothetical protein